jgi:uncharacterized protein YxjI
MRQRMFSIGEDFTIEDEAGHPAFEVDGKFMTLRETFELKDRQGNVVITIRGKLMSLRAKMDVFRGDQAVATITKALFSPFSDKYQVSLAGGGALRVDGDLFDHEYTLRRDDAVIASISKRWFTFSDTYGIDIAPGEDEPLILAIAVALDEMSHDPDEGRG